VEPARETLLVCDKAIYEGGGTVDSKSKQSLKLAGGGGELGHKAWKTRSSHRKMVLGDDVGLGEILVMSLCALVGQFNYWALPKTNIGRWMEKHWEPLLGYISILSVLLHGWFCFLFRNEIDAKLILEGLWLVGEGILMLKRWTHSFNPT
jgi:hypothetical protein